LANKYTRPNSELALNRGRQLARKNAEHRRAARVVLAEQRQRKADALALAGGLKVSASGPRKKTGETKSTFERRTRAAEDPAMADDSMSCAGCGAPTDEHGAAHDQADPNRHGVACPHCGAGVSWAGPDDDELSDDSAEMDDTELDETINDADALDDINGEISASDYPMTTRRMCESRNADGSPKALQFNDPRVKRWMAWDRRLRATLSRRLSR
jgi:hypothetical protein